MVVLKGIKVVPGIVIGKLFVYMHPDKHITRSIIDDTDAEIELFYEAREKAIEQLESLYESSIEYLGDTNASIFVAQEMLLEDTQYVDFVQKQIKENR